MRYQSPGLGPAFSFFLILLACSAVLPHTVHAAAKGRCASAVQGKIAWNRSGNKHWSVANIARLCKGAEDSAEPARCFSKIMQGGISWGGGTRWQWPNAIKLCQGARNARARISCFKEKVAKKTPWRKAIRKCRRVDALGGLGRLHTRPQRGVRKLVPPKTPGRDFNTRQDGADSGSVRFGDGQHGRRPPTGDGGQVRPGGGRSGNLSTGKLPAPDLGKNGPGRLTADPDARERLRRRPRVTGYRPSAVMQGGEVAVLGQMLGNAKGGRRLVLGVNADPDHGLARELTSRTWTPAEIRTRLPGDILPAKYFIALLGPDGKWVTNRLRTLRVLGKQRVSIIAVIVLKCYAEVTQYPKRVQVTLKPARPRDMGMNEGETFDIPVRYRKVEPGKFGSYRYVYRSTADLPQGLFSMEIQRPDGQPPFKARDWSRVKDAGGYETSRACAAHRRVNHRTGLPLHDPPVFMFAVNDKNETVRITRRTRALELSDTLFADLGSLPEPTAVDVD